MRFIYATIALAFLISCNSNNGQNQTKDTATEQTDGSDQKTIAGEAQGTTYHISYYGKVAENSLKIDVDSLLKQIDFSLSGWNEGSVITAMNTKDTNEVVVHDTFNYVTDNFKMARQVYVKTDGAFDPTIGPLVNLWGFGLEKRGNVTDESVNALLPLIAFDFQSVRLTRFDSTEKAGPVRMFYRKNADMQLDFNGIAQGYSVEKLAGLFNDQNIDSYMIELGGEIKTKGKKKDGTYWKIGVDKPVSPDEERQLQAVLTLKNQSVATSGSYRKFYEQDGERFSHTIDPKTGKPVTHNLLSTTVVMDDCTLADAYATAFMVMGTEKTKEFLQSNPDVKMEVYLIYDEGGEFKTWMSEGMKKMTEEI